MSWPGVLGDSSCVDIDLKHTGIERADSILPLIWSIMHNKKNNIIRSCHEVPYSEHQLLFIEEVKNWFSVIDQ